VKPSVRSRPYQTASTVPVVRSDKRTEHLQCPPDVWRHVAARTRLCSNLASPSRRSLATSAADCGSPGERRCRGAVPQPVWMIVAASAITPAPQRPSLTRTIDRHALTRGQRLAHRASAPVCRRAQRDSTCVGAGGAPWCPLGAIPIRQPGRAGAASARGVPPRARQPTHFRPPRAAPPRRRMSAGPRGDEAGS